MEQLKLPMLTVYTGPRLVDMDAVDACRGYREAVRTCWDMRTRRNLTLRALAEEIESYASHITDYLHRDDNGQRRGPTLRELAAAACVGYDAALHTVKNLARAGKLERVAERDVAYRNRPVVEYAPKRRVEQTEEAYFDVADVFAAWAR